MINVHYNGTTYTMPTDDVEAAKKGMVACAPELENASWELSGNDLYARINAGTKGC